MVISTQIILFSFFFFFLIFIARDVGGEHENVYNLIILPLKLKYAFRKICMISLHTVIKLSFNLHREFLKVLKPKLNIRYGQPSS